MTTYLALTIGPIYDTFIQARETRTVWAASYFFSWFIRETLTEAKKCGFHIMLPYSDKIINGKFGSGLYADRLYFVANEKTTQQALEEIVSAIVKTVTDDISQKLKCNKEEVETFINDYLNLHIIEATIDGEVLKTLNGILDHKELRQNFPLRYNRNFLLEYLMLKGNAANLITLDAFGNETMGLRRFRSIPEICTTSLERQNRYEYRRIINTAFKDESDIFNELESNNDIKKELRQYHKYYAVLYADGDNIGEILAKIGNDEARLQNFSERLIAFGKSAETKIAIFGGNGIYLGGEDVLTFAPMACVSNNGKRLRTIFDLIGELDQSFEKTVVQFAKEIGVEKLPTLSYGIMLSYTKHPLKESMRLAHGLMETAKDKNKHPDKNTIGLRFQKHSGQYIQCFIEKSKLNSKRLIFDFISHYCQLNQNENDILSGLIQRFRDELFYKAMTLAADGNRLEAFFQNYFNEDDHKAIGKASFITDVRLLCESVFADYPTDDTRQIIFTVLRIVHFINQKKD